MAKLYTTQDWKEGLPDLNFYCPGCECNHGVWVKPHNNGGATWEWNGNMDIPTFTPSIKVTRRYAGIDHICHMIITDGKINYQPDCTHKLAEKTIDMEEIN